MLTLAVMINDRSMYKRYATYNMLPQEWLRWSSLENDFELLLPHCYYYYYYY